MKKRLAFAFLLLALFAPLNAQKNEKVVATPQETVSVFFQKGGTLQLRNAPVGEKLQVLSIVGVRVFEKRLDASNQEIQLDLPQGYYIVKIGNIVRKISVK